MVSPTIKREIQLFLYVFSAKFLSLWSIPGFMRNLYTNSDLICFKRFSFDSFLKSSKTFFSNLLILEDQEINNCQFKKYHSNFLKILQKEYITNQNLLSLSPNKSDIPENSEQCKNKDSILKSFSEFFLLMLLVKSSFLEPKKFGKFLNFSKEEKSRNLMKEMMKLFKLGENYFGVEESDFFFLGKDIRQASNQKNFSKNTLYQAPKTLFTKCKKTKFSTKKIV